MAIFRVQGPDGSVYRFEGPDDATPAEVEAAAADHFGAEPGAKTEDTPAHADQPRSRMPVTTRNIPLVSSDIESAPKPAPYAPEPSGKIAGHYGDIARNIVPGAAAWMAGVPGDVESLGRAGLRAAGANVSRETLLPTTERLGDIAGGGKAENGYQEAGRVIGNVISTFGGPMLVRGLVGAAGKVIGGATKYAAALQSGVGPSSIQAGYDAVKEGPETAKLFYENLRDPKFHAEGMVTTADAAIQTMKKAKSAEYVAQMSKAGLDAEKIDMNDIYAALDSTNDVGKFKNISYIPRANQVRQDLTSIIDAFAKLDPKEYHTAAGFDALKKAIYNAQLDGRLAKNAAPGTPGAKIVGAVTNAIRKAIIDKAPVYSKIMGDYQRAEDELEQIQFALKVGDKAKTDSGIRALTSIFRNNVNTNFTYRENLGDVLDKASGGKLYPQIAGQSMASALPRGLGRILAGPEAAALAITNPALLPAMAASSPRIVGEAAGSAGYAARVMRNTGKAIPAVPNAIKAATVANNAAQQMTTEKDDQEFPNDPRDNSKRKVGAVYMTPKGALRWIGYGFTEP